MAKKSCKKGYYYCYSSKKCKKIPKGYHVMPTGYLMRDSEHKDEKEETNGKKKNGNGANGNGNGNGESSGGSDGGGVSEGWSAKYKRSIDCDNPKGFSQRAHCQGRKKVSEEAVSKKQQKFFGIVRAIQKGEIEPTTPETAKAARDMKKSDVKKFASTKHEGLPEKKEVKEESNPRIPRKKGQPANSKKHSDLYTDENPKGTIHGLGFKDVATAKASVAKIKKSSRSHAHKIQAAIAMEQRARVMGKTSEAAVFRKFINSMKKKTKQMNEAKGGDHEISMAQSQLKKSERNIKKLRKALGTKERDIPAWVQAKITDTEHNTDAAAGYMEEGKRDGKSAKDKGYSLRDWFKGGGWVQAGGKYDGKPCAKQPGQKTKPYCRDADDRASMSKEERNKRARKKRKEDPNPNRQGKAKNVTQESYSNWRAELEQLDEIAPLAAGAVVAGLAAAPYLAKKLLKPKADKALQRGRNELHLKDKPIGAGARGLDRQSYEPEGELVDEKFAAQGSLSYGSTPGKVTDKSVSSAVDKAIANKGTAASTASEEGKTGVTVSGSVSYSGRIKKGRDSAKSKRKFDKPNKPEKKPTGPDKPKPTNNKPKPTSNKPKPVPTRTNNRPTGGESKPTGGILMKSSYQPESELVDEGKKDACYHKVKSRYSVWPSAYASGALVKCRKVGAANWGNKTKKEGFSDWREDMLLEGLEDKLRQMSPEQIEDLIKANKGAEAKIRAALKNMRTPKSQGPGAQMPPDFAKQGVSSKPRSSTSYATPRETYKKGGSDRVSYQRRPRPARPSAPKPKVGLAGKVLKTLSKVKNPRVAAMLGLGALSAGMIYKGTQGIRKQMKDYKESGSNQTGYDYMMKKQQNEGYDVSNWRDDFQATEYESVDIIKTEPLQPTQGLGSDMLDEKKRLMNKLDKISGQLRKASAMHKKQSQEVAKVSQHLCAKEVKHEQFGYGETIFGEHAVPDENGFVSHYNIQFKHGIVENVSVEDVEVLTLTEHENHEMSGDVISEGGKKCWKGYKKAGTQKLFGKTYNRCVKAHFSDWRADMDLQEKKAKKDYDGDGKIESGSEEYLGSRDKAIKKAMGKKKNCGCGKDPCETYGKQEVKEDWQKSNRKDGVDGMSQKSVDAYKRENPGSKLQTAVTEKKPTGKRAKRRTSFCARSKGQKDMHNIDCTKTPEKKICKARKRWRC